MSRSRFSRAWLIIFSVVFLLQSVRTLLPLAMFQPGLWYDTTSELGITAQVSLVFCGGFFGYALLRWMGLRPALLFSVGGLVTARLALQFIGDAYVMMWLASAAVFCGWAALGLLLLRSSSQDAASVPTAIIAGVCLDAAINAAWVSWDVVWQRDALSIILIVLVGTATLAALHTTARTGAAQPSQGSPAALLATALFLSLHATLLANPAKMATVGGMSVFVAGMLPALFSGFAIALASIRSPRRISRPMLLLLALALGVLLLLIRVFESPLLFGIALLAVQTLAVVLFLRAFNSASHPSNWSMVLAFGAMGLVFGLLTVIVNFLGSIIRLPVYLMMAPAASLVFMSLFVLNRSSMQSGLQPHHRRWLLVFGLLTLIPLTAALRIPEPRIAAPDATSLRIMTYNIHQGIDNQGFVGLEAIARTIEMAEIDVVMLQEVSRGVIVNGSTDSLGWLAQRLRMQARFFAPDRQFGNAILTHLPIRDSDAGLLPRNQETGQRTYVRVRLDAGNSETLTVISTHFDHQLADNRLPQVERILEIWGGDPQTIIGGDFNATPRTNELARMRAAGLVSGQDATGEGDLETFIAFDPFMRLDYVMGSPDIRFVSASVPMSLASDHLPVVVEIALPLTNP